MAASLMGGLVHAGVMDPAAQLIVFEPDAGKARALRSDYGVQLAEDNTTLIEQADVVVLAIKPQMMRQVLQPLGSVMQKRQPLIVSIAAGVRATAIEHWLDGEFAIVRAMPNTPALVGVGASGLFANARVTDQQRQIAALLLDSVGISCWVESEDDIDSVTALSGSGPAYFMLFIKSLIEAAVEAGLDHDTAKALTVETARGSAELARQSEQTLQTLIDNVTSPGGTTEQALKSFAEQALPAVVAQAFDAARRRSSELADELGGEH